MKLFNLDWGKNAVSFRTVAAVAAQSDKISGRRCWIVGWCGARCRARAHREGRRRSGDRSDLKVSLLLPTSEAVPAPSPASPIWSKKMPSGRSCFSTGNAPSEHAWKEANSPPVKRRPGRRNHLANRRNRHHPDDDCPLPLQARARRHRTTQRAGCGPAAGPPNQHHPQRPSSACASSMTREGGWICSICRKN